MHKVHDFLAPCRLAAITACQFGYMDAPTCGLPLCALMSGEVVAVTIDSARAAAAF